MKRVLLVIFVLFTGIIFLPVSAHACSTFQECYPLAKKGDSEAQYLLGLFYFDGEGVTRSYPNAQIWFRKAAKQGHVDAQYILGYMYINHLGTPVDYDKALGPYMKDFKRGYGDIFNEKNIRAYTKSARKYNKIIQQGYEDVLNNKQSMSGNPWIAWFHKIMNAGLRKFINEYKRATERLKAGHYEEALKWFSEAAQEGNIDAQYQLGLMHANGLGTDQDLVTGYAWLKVAGAQGQKNAETALNDLKPRMSKSESRVAERLAKRFYKRYAKGIAKL